MIVPGILEKDFSEIEKKVHMVDTIAPLIQIDVADGILVDGKTFLEVKRLGDIETIAEFDLHLMVEKPLEYLKSKINHVVSVCTQVEAPQVAEFVRKARNLDYKVGLSINPGVPIEVLEPYLRQLDYIQFMGITPGAQGRKFNKKVIPKIKLFKKGYIEKEVWVDGGINEEILPLVLNAGADNVVMGSRIFRSESPRRTLINFKKDFKQ